MFACICRAVTSDEVSTAVDNGAATVEAVSIATGAGTGCGTCQDRIETMIGDPFDGRLENGRVYGRGSVDTKASLAGLSKVLLQKSPRLLPQVRRR